MELDKIYLGDCLEVMKRIPDKSVDMVLTDPPYGTTACKWDSVIPFEPMWEQLKRVTKDNGAIVLFGNEPFSTMLRASNISWYKYEWYWRKERGTNFLNFQYQPAKVVENIMVFGNLATSYSKKGTLKYYPQMEEGKAYKQRQGGVGESVGRDESTRQNKKNIITVNNGTRFPNNILDYTNEKGAHPTQKPVPLMEYLIKTYTQEGETVLDFTIGSGTTAVACVNLNRHFIGIEKEPTYYEIAKRRVEGAKRQGNLFHKAI